MRLTTFICWLCLLPSALAAKVPEVATDIAPVHALVARVMQGVGAPALIIRPGASPHEYALRPSEAAALARADLVVWIGPALTPWLRDALAALAGDARQVVFLEAQETIRHPLRRGAWFGGEGHMDGDHDPDGIDPHAWLDPVNGQIWLRLIADELSMLDPEHAGTYAANAAQGVAELEQARREIEGVLAPLRGLKYLVYHDAYQYFETRFNMPASGAVMGGDADQPGPARIAKLRKFAAEQGISCLLSGPQTDPRLMRAIFPHGAKTGILDPLGIDYQSNTGLYRALLLDLAKGFLSCAQ